MVLLDNIVQIFDLTYFNKKTSPACQKYQEIDVFKTRLVGSAFVHDDLMRQAVVVNRLFKERRAASSSRCLDSMKSRVSPNL